MSDREERLKANRAKEIKLKAISGLCFAALGFGLQALIAPPSPIPFLQDPAIAYPILGLGVIGTIITSILIFPVFMEKAELSRREEQ